MPETAVVPVHPAGQASGAPGLTVGEASAVRSYALAGKAAATRRAYL